MVQHYDDTLIDYVLLNNHLLLVKVDYCKLDNSDNFHSLNSFVCNSWFGLPFDQQATHTYNNKKSIFVNAFFLVNKKHCN